MNYQGLICLLKSATIKGKTIKYQRLVTLVYTQTGDSKYNLIRPQAK